MQHARDAGRPEADPDKRSLISPAPRDLRRRTLAQVRSEAPRGRRRVTVVIAAAAAILACGLGVKAISGPGQLLGPARIAAKPHGMRAKLRRTNSYAELSISGLGQPPVGEVYEVWLEKRAALPRPTDALFTVTTGGTASVEIPGDLRRVTGLLVTSEPIGGSLKPTGPTALRMSLRDARG